MRNHQQYPESYNTQNLHQEKIGQDSIFKGLIAKGWIDLQQEYLQEKGLPTNQNQAKTGMKELTKTFMMYA